MSSWNGKTKGGLLGYKIFVFILRHAGLFPAYFILRFVALYYFLFSLKSGKYSYYFFNKRLGFNVIKSLCGVYRNYYVFGQTIIDKIYALSGSSKKFTYSLYGEEHISEIVSLQKGGILVSAHAGNWEIAAEALNSFKQTINIVIYDGEHRNIKEFLSTIMSGKSVNVIEVKDDISHIYEITSALERKELVCIHGDRFIKGMKTIDYKFLGATTTFPSGLYYLAAQAEVPVSFVFAMKNKRLEYHFYATPPKIYKFGNERDKRNEIILQCVRDYTSALEEIINKYPYQWFNYYRFWKPSAL